MRTGSRNYSAVIIQPDINRVMEVKGISVIYYIKEFYVQSTLILESCSSIARS